jgi:hypothetical protein
MKKTLLGFLLLMISCKLNAQQQKLIIDPMQTEIRPELLTKERNSVKESNVFIDIRNRINANKHGLRKTSSSYNWKKTIIDFYSNYPYSLVDRTELYENGLVTSTYYKLTDSSSSSPYILYEDSYDGNGNLIEETGYSWANGKRIAQTKYSCSYNNKNSLLEENFLYWRDSTWELSSKQNYSYNSKNLLVETVYSIYFGEIIAYSRKGIRSYNSDDLLIEEVFSNLAGDTWLISEREVYTYNDKNLVSEKTDQFFNTNDSTWSTQSKILYTYNELSELIDKTYQMFEDSSLVNNYRYLYTYDNNKNVSEELIQWYSSGEWINDQKNNFENDSDGNIVTKSYSLWENDAWTDYYKILYYTGNEPFIDLIYPLGNDTYSLNSTIWIDWFGYGIDKVNIEFSSDNKQTWTTVTQNNSFSQQYEWKIPDVSSSTCFMKISSANNSSYYDINPEPFTIKIKLFEYRDQTTGTLTSSVFNNGLIGSSGDMSYISYIGSGFSFNNYPNALYSGGLIYGTPSTGIVGELSSFYLNDFVAIEPISDFTSDKNFDQILKARFTDSNALSPLGLTIEQTSFSKNGSDIILFSYNLINNTGVDIDSLSIGIFADWDVGVYSNNLGGYDLNRNLIYQYEQGGSNDPNFYGVVALSSLNGAKITGEGEYRQSLYEFMTNQQYDSIKTPSLYRSYISSGPYKIPAGASQKVGFAFLAGENLKDLQANTDSALSVWNNILVGVNENEMKTISTNYSLAQNYPNPFNPSTTIRYSISKSGLVQLKIYDILGREVAQLVNEEKSAGAYEVKFNAANLSSGIYFYRILSGNFTQTKKLMLLK